MNVQVIEKEGRPEWAVLPYAEYQRLLERLEDLQDALDADRILARVARGEEELVPAEVVERLLQGEPPLRVWREHRGWTQQQLASAAGVTQSMVTMIETGRRKGQADTLKRLAAALRIDLDDLVPEA
jgi:DNA-binding XRE family transcriptional regulator